MKVTIASAWPFTAASSTGPEARFHLLNTNKENSEDDQEMMLREHIAAAFFDPWCKNINRIKPNDWVFLYENKRGVIAFGRASGETLERDHRGVEAACRYQTLKHFQTLQEPLSAGRIKELLGRNVAFLRTMVSLPDGQKLLDSLNTSPEATASS